MQREFLSAKPVWAKGYSETKNVTCVFGAEFLRAEHAVLKITACNFYRVSLNGNFVGYGPARAAHGYFRVDEYVLDDLDKDNCLTIEVAGYRCNSFYALNQRPFLQAELLLDGDVIATGGAGSTFECFVDERRIRKSPRYSYQRAFCECYDFSRGACKKAETEILPDKKLLARGVDYPKFKERNATEAERGYAVFHPERPVYENRFFTQENIGIYPLGELECNPNELLSRLTYTPCEKTGKICPGEYVVFDSGTVKSGFIGISGRALQECEIYLLFDETDCRKEPSPREAMMIEYHRNDSLNAVYLKAPQGDLRFLSFEPYSFRYVKAVVFGGEIEIDRVYVKEYENPDAKDFLFSCEDKALEKIVQAAKNTFVQNTVDVPTDCPGRERAGWLCDSYFISLAEKLFTGKNTVEYNFLENYALAPQLNGLPEGMIGMCYPADFEKDLYIPNWAMWYVLELESYFRRTGDFALIEKSKPVVYGLLQFFEKYRNAEGLLEDLDGWIFIEWSGAGDEAFVRGVSFPTNMLYARALKAAAALYQDEALAKKAESMRKTIVKYSYNGRFFEDNAVRQNGLLQRTGHISETCQYYAFFTGIATPEKFPELWNTLVEEFGPTRDENKVYPNICKSAAFIGNYLRLSVLTEAKKYEQVLKECKEYFFHMAARTGTLWEHGTLQASLNHGFASYAANLVVGCLTGLVGVDEQKKKIYAARRTPVCKFSLRFPVKDGFVRATSDGRDTVFELAEGYEMTFNPVCNSFFS